MTCMAKAQGPWVSGLRAKLATQQRKSQVHMLQVICITSGTLKVVQITKW